jgi:hypothetical protein
VANWRLTSQTVNNITLALESGVWGEHRSSTLAPFSVGDRVAFYCSGGGLAKKRGFVATGTVVGEVFQSNDRIWATGLYPFRLPTHVNDGPFETPLDPSRVLERLNQTRFENMAPRKAVFLLADVEYEAIADLVRESMQAH